MLRLSTLGSPGRLVSVCQRCLSATVAAASCQTTAAPRSLSSPPLLLLQRQGSRGFLTLASVRAWLTEGPEAAAPVDALLPPPPPLPPSPLPVSDVGADAVTSSFFVTDAPAALQELIEGTGSLAAVAGEPTFASLGLGTGLWPSSMHLKVLEALHVTLDVPWWLCAVFAGVSVRLLLLLPNQYMQRMIRCDLPTIRKITLMSERVKFASRSNDPKEMLRIQQLFFEQFPEFFSSHGASDFRRRMLVTSLSNAAAIVILQLGAIRAIYKATSLPVESFQQGGILWFTDLTCIDPYFLLPAVITGLLMLNVNYYFKNMPPSNYSLMEVRPIAYTLLPAFVFTCMLNMPGANLVYFLTTGLTAQALHRLNSTPAGKAFWKSRIGLTPIEELPTSPRNDLFTEMSRIQGQIMPAIKDRDYQATRFVEKSGDAQIPKTFRPRQQQKAV